MRFREYIPAKDTHAIYRIWREIGWLREGAEEALAIALSASRVLVAEIHGEAESVALSMPGTVCYLGEDLPFCAITSVATSRIARRRGAARRLTAQLVAAGVVKDGALVAGLGMFEQGFYNQLGFGTGSYEHLITFDPERLKIKVKARVPRRLTPDDWEMVHAARLARARRHGSCIILPAEFTQAEMLHTPNGFGLGYCDGPRGELTHHFWCGSEDIRRGPYTVAWMTWQTREQFLELLALMKNLGDQVPLVRMREPAHIQFQDLIEQPFKQRRLTQYGKFEIGIRAVAYCQMRICDLFGCLARTHLQGDEVRFNLKLSDPIGDFLEMDAPWRGIAGDYVVTLGPSSGAELGTNAGLPTLVASVGAFTRMWLGVRPATMLSLTDELMGPPELLAQLDRVFCLPEPKPDWDF